MRDSGEFVTADTVFRWASISKGVAANTVLSLAEEGGFDLTDSAEALAPSLDLPGPKGGDVNISHLLSHLTRRELSGMPTTNALNLDGRLNRLAARCRSSIFYVSREPVIPTKMLPMMRRQKLSSSKQDCPIKAC